MPTLEEYVEAAVAMIQHTPAEVVYHRVSASARKPAAVGAKGGARTAGVPWWPSGEALAVSGGQGSALG